MPKGKKQARSSARLKSPRDQVIYMRIRTSTMDMLDKVGRKCKQTRVQVIRGILEDATGTTED